MTPKKTYSRSQIFQSRLDQQINHNHPLVKLSQQIDWKEFEEQFGSFYVPEKGRPGLPIRLLVGLTYLSRAFDFSDEAAVAEWQENPYWQYFCGYEFLQIGPPLDPSSLVRWRKRIGEEGVEFLLKQTLKVAKRTGQLTEKHLDKVNVDTTVQEKNITYPTDAKLYRRMLKELVKEAKEHKIPLRQSYVRLSKKALFLQGRYSHAQQMRRAAKEVKKLKIYLGRVARELRRKVPDPQGRLAEELAKAERLLAQERDSKNKLYSLHAPEVECIAKGKAHKKYEFGVKVGVVTTSRDNWVVGIQTFPGNPYDGHTLTKALAQTEHLTGWKVKSAYCDQGYRGHDYRGEAEINIVNRRRKKFRRSERKWRNRRAAVEPIIGHLKSDNRMGRNYLKGSVGDQINALLAGCGRNLRKLLQILFCPFFPTRFLALFPRFLSQRAGLGAQLYKVETGLNPLRMAEN